jgi:selenocysteine lyase/cysteine desulfurase
MTVREVPLQSIADALTERTALVAVSAVHSADGTVLDIDALLAAAARTRTKVMLDTTQAVGWLPSDASRVDYTVCGLQVPARTQGNGLSHGPSAADR